MRAIQVIAHGGPEVLEYGEVPDPRLRSTDLLVETTSVGVNFIDTYLRRGHYSSQPPYIPGSEGAGVIKAVGTDVTHFSVGDRVAWCDVPGSYAELVAVPEARAARVPAEVSDEIAGTLLLQALTAHYLLDGSAYPQAGDTILVHAGAGGVGLILTQLAHAKHLHVITTVSTDEKAEVSKAAGATHVLRYAPDLGAHVRKLTDGKGVRVTYDGVGKDTFDASLSATAVRGTVVVFGAASGAVPPFDLQRLNTSGSLSLTRPTLAHFIADPDEFRWRAGEVFDAVRKGKLAPRVGQTYPLAEAAQAHSDLESRATTGSIALIP
ncbi:quinone oxidoreductase family protein [Gordonia sp. CPCC 205333]|uniref:quinone oxidoreductase family protein n=1 Tax=Gordonia sp. CPCC 205333 TaxID=3140790 RepID=UPI003AF35C55